MTRIVRVVSADTEIKPETMSRRPSIGPPIEARPPRTSHCESMHPPCRPYPTKKVRLWGTDRGEDD